ncbi:alpha/beta hydrolase [Rhodocista pekingensis]|uniref:Alpha/beta hydrolase n=1 Tax=Rhodocista pekingensis TaxID=201185 RepID=A0ABW2KX76_9PROT
MSTAERGSLPRRRAWVLLPALLLALVLAGCAPTLQPMGPRVAAPTLEAETFRTADGEALPLRHWLPAGKPRAVILALHGFNDYSNAFDSPARFWAAHGVATYAYDQRGFGGSGRPGIWPGSDTLTQDVLDAAAALNAAYPGVPLYLLGESMGGAVLLAAFAGRDLPPGIAGLLLSAPAVWSRDTMPFYQRWALSVAGWTVPWLKLSPPRGLDIQASDNIEVLRALGRDPLVLKETRVDAVRGLTDLMDQAMAGAEQLAVPALVLYGENEQVIPVEPRSRAMRRLPLAEPPRHGPRLALYPHGWHLLLRDLNAETVWRDVLAWIADPHAALPSGADRNPRVLTLLDPAPDGAAADPTATDDEPSSPLEAPPVP